MYYIIIIISLLNYIIKLYNCLAYFMLYSIQLNIPH